MTTLVDEDVTVVRIADQGLKGPCAARNRALREAGTTWVLLLDEDAFPEEGCLERLLAEGGPDVGLVVPRVEGYYCGGDAHFLGELCFTGGTGAAASTALLVRRGAAWFDEELVFFREDLDFCLRLRANGWAIRTCDEAVVRHDRSLPRGPLHGLRAYYQTRNRWLILRRWLGARMLLATLPLQLGYELLNLAARWKEAGQWAAGLRDGLGAAEAGRPDLFGAPALSWRRGAALKPAVEGLARLWWRFCGRH